MLQHHTVPPTCGQGSFGVRLNRLWRGVQGNEAGRGRGHDDWETSRRRCLLGALGFTSIKVSHPRAGVLKSKHSLRSVEGRPNEEVRATSVGQVAGMYSCWLLRIAPVGERLKPQLPARSRYESADRGCVPETTQGSRLRGHRLGSQAACAFNKGSLCVLPSCGELPCFGKRRLWPCMSIRSHLG